MNLLAWVLAPALAASISAATPPSDPAALDRAIEEAAETQLAAPVREGRTSAAVVVFVRDGEVRLERGWGFEDVDRRNPVDASSRFEIDSLSKVFTAVTLAVLRNRGLIRSYADPVNGYLEGWQLPEAFGAQVTIDELATHSAGLEESLFGTLSTTPPNGPARAEDLARRMPGFFAPPGSEVSYSSYGVDVLGQMIADVVGEPYPKAVEHYVLRPLGMDGTFVRGAASGEREVIPFPPWRPVAAAPRYPIPSSYPSVGFMTTARDMERLLLALLDREGRQPVITAAIQDDLFRVHQAQGEYGAAHGLVFDLFRREGRTLLHHGGLSRDCSCYLALSPSDRAGLFYCHTDAKTRFGTPPTRRPPDVQAVRAAMLAPLGMDFAFAPKVITTTAGTWNDAWNAYLGAYLSVYRGHHGILRLRSVLHADGIRVTRGTRGLRIGNLDGLTEIAPGVFGAPGLGDTFAFERDGHTGRMTLSRATGFSTYEQPPLLDDARLFVPLFAAVLLVAASGLAFVLPAWKVVGQTLARTSALAFAAVMLCGTGVLYGFHAFGDPYYEGVAWPIVTVRVLGFLTVPAAVFLSIVVWRAFRRPLGGLPRLHLAALAVAAWTAVALLVNFGLIGFSPLV